MLSSEGIDKKDHVFIHPFLQLWGFAVGEFASIFLCLIWYFIKKTKVNSPDETLEKKKKINPLLLLPPALFEMLMLSAFFIALVFTTASSFQILSGANIIFGCIFSRIFLKRKLEIYQWIAIFITIGFQCFEPYPNNYLYYTILYSRWSDCCWTWRSSKRNKWR